MSDRVPAPVANVRRPTTGPAYDLAVFAATMMAMIGVFQVFAGLAAMLRNAFYVVSPNYAFSFDVTVWGWVHLLLGVLLAAGAYALLAGRAWGRSLGIALAALNAIANFVFIPYYPVWSLLIIALDVAVIWALAVYSGSPER